MLQNPSKYHANPLSHFLALHHNTQMVHNGRAPLFPPNAINGETMNQHFQQTLQQQQQQQQQQQPQNLLTTNNMHSYQQQQQQQQHQQQQQIQTHNFDASNSALDAGKSFTIAAILGLQKTAIENNCKDYNNSVINLSMNDSQFDSSNNNNNSSSNICDEQFIKHNNKNNNSKNSNNNNNEHKFKNNNNNNKMCNFNNLNRYENEKLALMNRYLPSTNAITAPTLKTEQQQQQQQQQQRANNFVAAAAVAVAAAANVTNGPGSVAPSALQSLQQLHQHHVQQNNLSFPRDKPKENNKRSALKNKRVRTIFTPEQLERLEAEFERQQYMVGPERLYLAHTLQLTEAQVKVWFQNRRIKWRKHHLEITHQRLALLRQTQVTQNPNSSLDVVNTVGVKNLETPGGDDSSDDKYADDDMKQLDENRQPSESDLSICNDSVDNDSAFDAAENT